MNTTFNSRTYDLAVQLVKVNPNKTDEELDEKLDILPMNVKSISLINDISMSYPSLELKIIDPTLDDLIKYYNDGYSYIKIRIQYNIGDGKNKDIRPSDNEIDFNADYNNTTLEHIFSIDDISLDNTVSINEMSYIIKGVSILQTILNSYCEYSTFNQSKTYTTIIRDILKQHNYCYKKAKQYPETDKKGTYISPSNFTVHNNIDYLLQQCASVDRGLFYLIFNMLKAEGQVYSINDIFNDNKEILATNNFYIPSKAGVLQNPALTTFGLKTVSYIKGGTLFNINSPIKNFQFNYLQRSRVTQELKNEKLLSGLPKIKEFQDKFELILKKKPDYLKIKKNTQEFLDSSITNNQLWYKMDRLFRYTNVSQFTINPGYLIRDVGQLFTLFCNDKVINTYYGGVWMIGRIQHEFVPDGKYSNIIHGIRSLSYKAKVEENEII